MMRTYLSTFGIEELLEFIAVPLPNRIETTLQIQLWIEATLLRVLRVEATGHADGLEAAGRGHRVEATAWPNVRRRCRCHDASKTYSEQMYFMWRPTRSLNARIALLPGL